jgi:hypothetical protein
MATKRKDLFIEQGYLEFDSNRYFWTPDGVGVFWFDTKEELLNDLDCDDIFIVLRLED